MVAHPVDQAAREVDDGVRTIGTLKEGRCRLEKLVQIAGKEQLNYSVVAANVAVDRHGRDIEFLGDVGHGGPPDTMADHAGGGGIEVRVKYRWRRRRKARGCKRHLDDLVASSHHFPPHGAYVTLRAQCLIVTSFPGKMAGRGSAGSRRTVSVGYRRSWRPVPSQRREPGATASSKCSLDLLCSAVARTSSSFAWAE